jgi:hypothetical protein
MVRSHTGARLAEQLIALEMARDVPLAILQRAAALVFRKLQIELV